MVSVKQKTALILLIAGVLAVQTPSVFAQQTVNYTTEIDAYRKGLELYDKKLYGSAQRQFFEAIDVIGDPNAEISVNSQYYAALCAVELFHKDAEYLVKEFIRSHPESPHVKLAYFQLGRYNYRKRKWNKTIEWMDKVNIRDLSQAERSELYFSRGYSYFMMEDYDNASKDLYEIKDKETKYYGPALFYYAHINYEQGNRETALKSFQQLEGHEKFGPIIPYYIAQIYYQQERYDELLAYAPALLDKAVASRASEIARLIADAYYRTERYEESIPYLELYLKKNRRPVREDQYELAYAYFKTGRYKDAAKYFTKTTYTSDTLCQNGLYHLAHCYLALDKKDHARNAFKSAYQLEFDPEISEDALFSYAKLSYELALDPYQNSLNAFREYTEKYPSSERADEAYQYMVSAYLNTNNYSAAISSLESMNELSPRLKSVYQQVCFNRGVELFNSRQYGLAIKSFKKAQTQPVDPATHAMTYFWIADANYKKGNYKEAIDRYWQFTLQPRAVLQPEFNIASYNIGYAKLKENKYESAETWFRKFLKQEEGKTTERTTDAHLRIGDTYFIRGEYNSAIDYYKVAVAQKSDEADYALHKQAMALGYLGRSDEKMKTLDAMLAEYPESSYNLMAKYELGRGYLAEGNNAQALNIFNDLIDQTKDRPGRIAKDALVSKGILYFNQGKFDEALPIFQDVVKRFPTMEQSREAIQYAQNIYSQTGRVTQFEQWIDGLDFMDLTNEARDSIYFASAENTYHEGNCEEASRQFASYLERFPKPLFKAKANFYSGECLFGKEEYQEALTHFEVVAEMPFNTFSELATYRTASLQYYYRNYEEALEDYQSLERLSERKETLDEALAGQMRCHFELNHLPEARQYAQATLESGKEEEGLEEEIRFIIGKSAFAEGDLDVAYEQLARVGEIGHGERGVESRYHLSEILFAQERYEECQTEIYRLVKDKPGYKFWVAKSLILLSDKFLVDEDFFQAKATLQSILDYYQGNDELLDIATEKMTEIDQLEAASRKQGESEVNEELDFGYDELFEEELTPEEENLESNLD